MKRIVICCDGTWKRADSPYPTNVARLTRAVPARGPDGTEQALIHLDGVGTGRGTGWTARTLDRVLGGAFGQGLVATLAEAYRFLALNYAPGDEIHVFGFSRGAYTARSLAGLIRACGIPSRADAARIPEAIMHYRRRTPDGHPDAPPGLDFRAGFAPEVVTSAAELAWRCATMPERDWSATVLLEIAYLGIWDTVGALGVPAQFRVAAMLNRRHRFHDTRLSSSVRAARHAVAIDEMRRAFPPTLWDNIDALNLERPSFDGPNYRQFWFPGDHGAVGGGGDVTALADDALLWVVEGAVAAGLAVDSVPLAKVAARRNCLGPLGATSRPGALARLLARNRANRTGPARPGDLAAAALLRWKADPAYRPLALAGLANALDRAPVRVIGGGLPRARSD